MSKRFQGNLDIRPREGDKPTVRLQGDSGTVLVGGGGEDGQILLRGADQKQVGRWRAAKAEIELGGNGTSGRVALLDKNDRLQIELDGESGDIRLLGADCAEEMPVDAARVAEIEPGTVLVIGADGPLRPCDAAYDHRVLGVVAGAGGTRPGIVLGHQPAAPGTAPRRRVTSLGRVGCKVDASFGAVEPGDLLTTSPTTGHAMKALDPARRAGSVLGKALGGLAEGRGVIQIWAALQ